MALQDRQLRPPSMGVIAGIAGGIAALVFLSASVVIVPAGERAVIFDKIRGVLEDVRSEGITFIVPFIQKAILFDVKTQNYNFIGGEGGTDRDNSVEGRTHDGQTVHVDMSVRAHPTAEETWKVYKEIGVDYEEKIIIPQVRSVVRNVIAEYNAQDTFSSKRRDIQDKIARELERTFKQYHIHLNEALIRNIRFSEEYQKAVEAKQVAEQAAQTMQYVLQKQRQEKERKIIEAEGEARSIQIRGQALSANPRVIQYEYVQKLAPGIKAVITDQKTIMNFSNFLDGKE